MRIAYSLDGDTWHMLPGEYEKPAAAWDDFVRAACPGPGVGDTLIFGVFEPCDWKGFFPTADFIVEKANMYARAASDRAETDEAFIPTTFDSKPLEEVLQAIWRGFFADVTTFEPGTIVRQEVFRIASGFLPEPVPIEDRADFAPCETADGRQWAPIVPEPDPEE